ncbi:MAG: hypothetical protein A3F83_07030 [Candidatus Glassbacteria bacterium RIFCSPLOWO2_12_FULL_58_11]|uniref:HNH nuclease domain-containing protein n=1 Tax=Candidatus Glassbacteria bacterium RIFCSPLOWO2_12_FULL_58_11 TaxID=1817867 RepID=A0A1F5YSJ6_9BACT|nr:MAG: hypothetical protein A3F83_07030 [Candidatus Glassbacteria bacterium RIFCSPLOWO2_12_FULL_58_11]
MTKDIPARTKKLIMQETAGNCAFCGEDNVATLEFHHIQGKDIPDPHNPNNLIYVCKNCHGRITAGDITKSEVLLKKRTLKHFGNMQEKENRTSHAINISGSVVQGTIANEIHYHGQKKPSLHFNPPIGAIATDLYKKNYLKYLIDLYHEYASAEKGDSFKYPVFYQTIKRCFGAKWDMIPIEQFDDVCNYVQTRIDKTIRGKIQKARNEKNYSNFTEFREKYQKKKN